MADIESGIVESKKLHVLGVCCKWAGWALHVADGWWDFLSLLLRWWTGQGSFYNGSRGDGPKAVPKSGTSPTRTRGVRGMMVKRRSEIVRSKPHPQAVTLAQSTAWAPLGAPV